MLEVCFRFLSVYSGNSATACSPFLAVGLRKPVQPLYLWSQYPCWVLPVGDGLLALLPVKAQRPAVRSFFFYTQCCGNFFACFAPCFHFDDLFCVFS